MNWLFSPPTFDDLTRLLKAWRFWVLAALVGALLGAGWYHISPPPFRARAIVNVDFNLEEAWPEETDRQQFYYLERETRKLEEIAWSDDVLQTVKDVSGEDIPELRGGILSLSQPGEGGWHFFADARDPARAVSIASIWASAFAEQTQSKIASQSGISSFILVDAVQVNDLPVSRRVSQSVYLLAGLFGFMVLGALLTLFIKPKS